mmetsp:Transcript_44921/g.123116  ORF Transcript_44921/g.123116 Transcript_44921/m.123116 type:complete len:485 (-) Transcript_44921:282-1736(-)|eukprot:CAMPEP_0119480474 /NCGR_PEP_ID=MMETSP1344-20130328/9262_1 /TAXON_ID=236787 /ORGANISM="Florenciella parvula, Strain CCMP2471" /LENGTH=484 /DNA_ID=CAMNT_0007514785 /DNA_START=79 /DNA_END=1533 /DNA_ORIENTATION=+
MAEKATGMGQLGGGPCLTRPNRALTKRGSFVGEDASLVLVADCGGTNSRMQIYLVPHVGILAFTGRGKKAPGELLYEQEFANSEYIKQGKGWKDIYFDFLKNAQDANPGRSIDNIRTLSLAVAGPVENNTVTFTSIKPAWTIDGNALADELNIENVKLMNDFVANGYGLLTLDESVDCKTVQANPKRKGGPIACVGPGTGLGECYLTTHKGDDEYVAYPSEGGHTEFAPRNELEFELLQYLMKKFEQRHRVSVERVISGRGLANVFEFLCQHKDFKKKVSPAIQAEFEAAGDLQGKVVGENVDNDPVCKKAMDIFVSAYGSEAGSVCLKFLPFGGLYLAGGLTPKNLKHIGHLDEAALAKQSIRNAVSEALMHQTTDGNFIHSFLDKGRLSFLLEQIPVYAVMDQSLGQRGAHYVAVKLLKGALEAAEGNQGAAAVEEGEEKGEEVGDVGGKEAPASVPTSTLMAFAAGALVASLVCMQMLKKR